MTYFHRRTSTIIGAKAFHCPVRDGKEWDHLAMVVKRNWLRPRPCGTLPPIWQEAQGGVEPPGNVFGVVTAYWFVG
jgi:hypothetical protein